jgi:hypothetical protein
VEGWERDGKTSVVIPGADHGLERPGDPIGSVEALGEMLRPLATWLDKAGA